MCGILAIQHDPQGAQMRSEMDYRSVAQKALEAMRHRGPDDSGMWYSRRASTLLASVRLAIVGPANGRQPLLNETGELCAVVNGEFYEYQQLRLDLEKEGHHFSTDSDSELLVHLYEEHGLDCFKYLRGEFAFILCDARQNQTPRLIAARDRFGIKPLHFSRYQDGWILGSEIKALTAAGVSVQWDLDNCRHALAHQYLPVGETLFRGIKQIPPADYAVIVPSGYAITPYWRPAFPKTELSESGTAERAIAIRQALEQAVAIRIPAEAAVACTLSGGLDSSAVAAIAVRRLGKPLDCFSVRFDAPGYDEGERVRADVALLKEPLRLHEVNVSRRSLALELEAAVWKSEGLAINGQLVGKYLLSKAINAAGYKVVLAGEGADEAFLGYAHLQQDYFELQGAVAPCCDLQYDLQKGIMLPEDHLPSDWIAPNWLGFTPSFVRAKLAIGRHFIPLLAADFRAGHCASDLLTCAINRIHATGELPECAPQLRKSAWLWTRLALGNYILKTLGDGAEMAHSVECRLPFLDHHLFDLAAAIPASRCFRNADSKAILRDALVSVLPDPVRLRPKHPFLAPPLLAGSDSTVADFVADTLRSPELASIPFLDRAAVIRWGDRLLQSPAKEQTSMDPVLMTILTATFLQKQFKLAA